MAGPPPRLSARQQTTGDETVGSNGPAILAVTGTLMGLSFVVVLLRCYIRLVMLKSFSIDDGVIVVALIMAILAMVCFIQMVHYGAGMWHEDIPADWLPGLNFWSYIIGPFCTSGISLVKISVGFFLRRFVQQKWQKKFLLGMIIFSGVFMVYSILTFCLACIPLDTLWVAVPDPNAKCWSMNTLSLLGTINGVINVVADLVFVVLPIPVVVELQVNRRTKTILIGILSLGLFACVASIARMVYAYHRTDPDYTQNFNFIVWFDIEMQAGILAASLPVLRPLVAKVLKSTSQLRSYGYGRSRYGTQSQTTRTRVGYYRQDDIPMEVRGYNKSGAYNAEIGTANKSLEDDGSEDGILPVMGGISKRTEIVVHEDARSAA
ncbi:hypothetical protein BX600DRAFT_154369 [Xylariales sp. PMI_506]|nr:hypothetical protein BX600DRAFT_154369 [Xylariales sp. PMI_506]